MFFKTTFENIWKYRHFIKSSVVSENKHRFARSKLGGLWLLLHPLAQAAILAVVLSRIMRAKYPGIGSEYGYAIYLLAGTLGWSFFMEVLNRSVSVFTQNANVMKKIQFPKICLPVIVATSSLINHFMLLACTIVIFLFLGQGLSIQLLWLPLVILVTLIFATGLGLILGILNVFMRDISQIIPIVLQFLYWGTPIVYNLNILPENMVYFVKLNPLYYLIKCFQDILAYQVAPSLEVIATLLFVSLALMALALFLFRKAGPDLVDEL